MATYRFEVVYDDVTDAFYVSEPEGVLPAETDYRDWDPDIAEWSRDHIMTSLGEGVLV